MKKQFLNIRGFYNITAVFLGPLICIIVFCLSTKPVAALNFYPVKVSYHNDTVFVAPPTGEREKDRTSILTALDLVQPDGTIQFESGTYLVGKGISVKVPGVTLLGHSDGTIIRGCDPAEMEDREFASINCNGIELAGSNQTVRGFTFEYGYWALHLGCCRNERIQYALPNGMSSEGTAIYNTGGGHLVEDNTFRSSMSGIRMNGDWTEPAIIRNNRFINNWHGVSINGNTVYLLNNEFSVPEPVQVPIYGFPRDAVKIGPPLPLQNIDERYLRAGVGNIVEGNMIRGYHQGISIEVYEPGTSCRDNIIRNNIIEVRRGKVLSPIESDSSFVGNPLVLQNFPEALRYNGPGQESLIEANIIEGNRIIGGEGLGIEMLHASRNHIRNNTITAINKRVPFLDNIFDPRGPTLEWSDANGSGIWVSPGSNGNEILNNTFKDIASAAVFIEGDSNRVEVQEAGDIVRDLGAGNRVIGPEAEPNDPSYEEKFIEAGSVRLHYLDFGGDGLPLVLVHSEGWDAYTYAEFAPRFTNTNRVLSITRPGYGKSQALTEDFGVANQAESLIAFLDALGIEQAIFAGNSSPITYLTYLVEHHPDRVAGVIYLAGLMPMWLNEVQNSDPAGVGAMVKLARTSDSVSLNRSRIIDSYRPEFLSGQNSPIYVPALAFAGRSGLIGYENFSWPLALVGSPLMRDFYADLPPSPATDYLRRIAEDAKFRDESLVKIKDSSARSIFTLLADDPEQQEEIWQYQQETVRPALVEGQENFRRAFGTQLQLVPLDVSVIYGYEYRDAPELIEPHIQRFLEMIPFNKK